MLWMVLPQPLLKGLTALLQFEHVGSGRACSLLIGVQSSTGDKVDARFQIRERHYHRVSRMVVR